MRVSIESIPFIHLVMNRIERERAVIGTLLLESESYRDLPLDFDQTAFETNDYRELFSVMKAEYMDPGQPISLERIIEDHNEIRPLLTDITYLLLPLGGRLHSAARDLMRHIAEADPLHGARVGFIEDVVAEDSQESVNMALSDLGNSERFILSFGHSVRYNHSSRKWLIWNGKYWENDETGMVCELAKRTIRSVYGEAERSSDAGRRVRLARFALKSENHHSISDLLRLASTNKSIAVTSADLDKDRYYLNVRNGTYDLRAGKLMSHDPEHLITKLANVLYDPEAKAPFWDSFLNKVFNANVEVMRYLQRCVGYSLTGDVSEQKLFFCYGTGKNGKTVFFETMRLLFGDYWQKAPAQMLMVKHNESIPNDVARLAGIRFVVCSEIQEGRRLDEARVKDISGGDRVVARFLYGELFEFSPVHKIWVGGNFKPIISGTDEGIWRRIALVPFTTTISETERLPMAFILAKMKQELSGILNWAIGGVKEWSRDGLNPPADVDQATEDYRAEMDVVGNYLKERCSFESSMRCRARDLFNDYQSWCTEAGEHPLKRRTFDARIKAVGFRSQIGSGNYLEWHGIGLSQLS